MHRVFAFGFMLFAGLLALAPTAAAQNVVETTITTTDPGEHSQRLADRMIVEGVSALRPILTQLYAIQVRVPSGSVQLPPQLEAQFSTIQTVIAGRRSSVTQKLDDVSLADTMRTIYYYHYYGDNIWIFTRFDYVRVSADRWAVSLVLWGGDPGTVGISPQLNYRPTMNGAR